MKAVPFVPVPPFMVMESAVIFCAEFAKLPIPALLPLPDVPPLMLIAAAVMSCVPVLLLRMAADGEEMKPGMAGVPKLGAVPPVMLISPVATMVCRSEEHTSELQ